MAEINWGEMFLPSTSIIGIMIRGTIVYFALFALIRLFRKRQAGAVSASDLLVLVIIADASQNAMSAEYKSITEGLILAATIIFWSYALDAMGYAYPIIGRFVHPPPLMLVKEGVILQRNLKREQLTQEELMSQLREQGVEDVSNVRAAYMEGDGNISVIQKEEKEHAKRKRGPGV
jgi:uncharacterized membrane protein YcaP (DUF421 family)